MAEPAAVAIVGIGGLFPGAASISAFWDNIVHGVDGISDVPADRWDPVFFDPKSPGADRFYCRRGGFVDSVASFDPTEFGIMPVAVQGAEPDQLLALAAAAAALADAGDMHRELAPERIGVIIGRGGYMNAGVARLDQRVRGAQQLVESLRDLLPDIDEETLDNVKADFQRRLGPERPESSIGLVPNLAASRIANRLDFQGPAYTIDAACASSLIAVERGMEELASGRCDLMLVGGVHHCHDLTLWSVFTQLEALSHSQEIRPFSRDADGILIGEGTGLFVLKRLADAERDDDRIYAVIRGSGVASDGRDASLMSPRPEGQVLAVSRAWKASGLDPTNVGLIEAHGTATRVGDTAELQTLRTVFGALGQGEARAGLGSVKSMIGHAMPAAGAAGLAKAALALFHRQLPPTLHVGAANAAVDDTRFRLIGETEPWESTQSRLAGVNAFGFGGINAHLVLEEHPSSHVRPSAAPVRRPVPEGRGEEVLLLAGVDATDLLTQLDRRSSSSTTPLAAPSGGPARLAVVDPTPKRLGLARKVLERGTPFRGRNDVWFEPEGMVAAGGKVAYLFPGVEPVFEPRTDDIAAHFGLDGLENKSDGPALEAQSLGIIATGRLIADALEHMGVRPDLMAGHSLGEWTGQIVSGMIPNAYIDPFLDSLRPGSIEVSDVVFLALGCGADKAAELISGLEGAFVSHDNCVHQSVICAHPDVIVEAVSRAKAKQVIAQELPFRSGFHSPLFEPFVAGLAGHFDSLPLERPSVPLWSATSCAPYPSDPAAIAELSLRHLVEPVRFRELVLALHAQGVRAFVQVGTGSLGSFVDDTLRDLDYLVVPTNVAKRTGMAQLRRSAAALWVQGVEVDFSSLAPVTHHSRAQPLPLGSALVRNLEPLAWKGQSRAGLGTVHDPVTISAFDQVLDEQADAARRVLAAAKARRVTPTRRMVPARDTAAPIPTPTTLSAASSVGAAVSSADPIDRPSRSLTVTRTLSLTTEPAWADHAFFPQPSGWPHAGDRFPLVPMTGILEMFAELAIGLVPGHVPVSVSEIRAFQWLAVEPPNDVTFRAAVISEEPNGDVLVATSIDRHARAVVRLAAAYPVAPSPTDRDLHGNVPIGVDVAGVYAEGHLFHGPAYQGLRSFDHFATDGARGRLVSHAAPGALLDNAGQLFGYWVACAVERDRLVLPTSIDRISFFGPHPTPGTIVECVVHVTDLRDLSVRCDIELTVGGELWCRLDGWEDRRFQTDDRLFSMLRKPSLLTLAEPQPGGWVLVHEAWPDSATRDVVRRRYLDGAERAAYDARNPNAQRQWLLGRIAAKDAAREHLWQRGAGPLFPIEVTVDNDDLGQPTINAPGGHELNVSIAHRGPFGVALVAADQPVGIDIETVETRSDAFESMSFADSERKRLERLDGSTRDRAVARLWAAKEAAAKAAGTGLGGRPKDWVTEPVEPDLLRVADRLIATTIIGASIDDPKAKEHVVAWTIPNP